MKTIAFDPLKQRALPTALAVAAALALTACGGGGSSTTAGNGPVTAASGVVIDGYIDKAKVCADLNNNDVCDEGEPSVLTGPDGSYSGLEAGSATTILVETTNESSDADDTVNGVTKTLAEAGRAPFTLKAPATVVDNQEKFVVTPLTTMVALAIQEDPNLTPKTAGDALVKQLGLGDPTTVDFFADYKAANNDFMGKMAQGIADSLGEAEKLFKANAEQEEFGSLKKDLFKDAMQRTWTGMVANIRPDGTLIRPPEDFRNQIKAEVELGVATIVTAARFAPDKAFLDAFDLEGALGVRDANGNLVKTNEGKIEKTRLYIGACRSKNHLLADLSDAQKQKLKITTGSEIQPIFCGDGQYALLETVEIGTNSPWPVPRAYALFGASLGSANWKPFPNGADGGYYILTNEGLELYDGDQTATPKPFRPRTANPESPIIKSDYQGKCFTVEASGYGEKYCFDPVKMEDKKVSALDPACKAGYVGECSIDQANDKTFPAGSIGFNVTQSFMYDTYQFFSESGDQATGSPDQASGADSDKPPSFKSISEGIDAAKAEGKSVEVCDAEMFGNFTYFFKFLDGDKIQLTGISGPKSGSCAPWPDTGELTPDVAITKEQPICDVKNTLTASNTRGRAALDTLCEDDGALKGITIGPEEIAYDIIKPNSSANAKDIEVFRTGMFGITKILTKNFRKEMGLVNGSEFSPNGFAATVIQGSVATGVFWAKDAPVMKLSFLNGEEKVFNDIAGKTILEAFGAPKFEEGKILTVDFSK